ncbi:MAG: hypothetical protein V2B20_25515 [Pseudomonadota bacterium]
MEQNQIEEILQYLPKSRTKFYYFKDRYALMLLSYAIGQREGMKVAEIKKSTFGRLMEKPLVKEIAHHLGKSNLTRDLLDALWPKDFFCYLLTVDKWGGRKGRSRLYDQTSRPGCNLVLQLNFSAEHNTSYQRLIKPQNAHPFKNYGHPIAKDGKNHTLAWARIDIDLETGEALIEEIQTDWIRLAARTRKDVEQYGNVDEPQRRYIPRYLKRLCCNAKELSRYVEDELKPHAAIWEEAMLMSTIWFLKEEIGISTIFYHTFDFGCQLKRIEGARPPQSLYTTLPKKFCFEKTGCVPSFLQKKSNRRTKELINREERQFYSLIL